MITEQELTIPAMMVALCQTYKISKGTLADEIGCAKETLSRWIHGHSEIPKHIPDTLKGIELRLIEKL